MTSILRIEAGRNGASFPFTMRGFASSKAIATILATWALLNLAVQTGVIRVPTSLDLRIVPREFLFHSTPLEAMLTIILLITCYYLAKGKRLAWNVGSGTLFLSIALHALHRNRGIDPVLLFAVSILAFLIFYRDRFRISGRLRLPNQNRAKEAAYIIIVFASILLISAAAFYVRRDDFGPVPDVAGSIWLSLLSAVMADTTGIYHPLSNRAVVLIESITAAYIILYAYVTSFAYTWFSRRKYNLAINKDASYAIPMQQIIDVHGRHSINCFATSHEKQIFFSSDKSTLISCRITSGVALSLGDPIGPSDRREQAIKEFISFCREADIIPAIYQGHHGSLPTYRKLGFQEIKVGEEAIIDPSCFGISGSSKKNLRNSITAATRYGIEVKILQPIQIIGDERLCRQLDDISADWLSTKGKKNIGFSCSKIHHIKDLLVETQKEEDARNEPSSQRISLFVAVAFDRDSNLPLAFAVVRSYPNNYGAALDALRRAKNSPNGTIELLISSVVMSLKAFPNITEFSLGLAPLADSLNEVSILKKKNSLAWRDVIEKIGFTIGNATTTLYNYNQLFRFKSKFDPRWENRYLVIPSMTNLPRVLYSITKAHLE